MSHVKTMDLVSNLKMATSASVQKSLLEQDVKVNLTTHFYLVTYLITVMKLVGHVWLGFTLKSMIFFLFFY